MTLPLFEARIRRLRETGVESWLEMTRLSVEPLAEGYAQGVSALWSRLGAS